MATITNEQVAEWLRELSADVRESQREIVLRLDQIERGIERESSKWDLNLSFLKMDVTLGAYLVVLILVSAIAIASGVVINHL